MAEVKIDPLQLALRYGFRGDTQDGLHLANGMFAPWDAIKRMAFDRARLADEMDKAADELERLREILGDIKNYAHKTDDVRRWCDEGLDGPNDQK